MKKAYIITTAVLALAVVFLLGIVLSDKIKPEAETTASSVVKPAADSQPKESEVKADTESAQNSSAETTPQVQGSGTLKSPIALNQAYSYHDEYNPTGSKYQAYSSDTTIKIKKSAPISPEEMVKLGLRKPEPNPAIKYLIVDIDLEVTNAKVSRYSEGESCFYLNLFAPSLDITDTPAGNTIIGGTDSFDGGLSRDVTRATEDNEGMTKKIKIGETGAFKASGKLILPVSTIEESFLVVEPNVPEGQEEKEIFFKLT